jgi:hypothetical protein
MTVTLLELVVRMTKISMNFTGFDMYQTSGGHKLCSMKFEDTNDFFIFCFTANPLV